MRIDSNSDGQRLGRTTRTARTYLKLDALGPSECWSLHPQTLRNIYIYILHIYNLVILCRFNQVIYMYTPAARGPGVVLWAVPEEVSQGAKQADEQVGHADLRCGARAQEPLPNQNRPLIARTDSLSNPGWPR